MNEGDAERETKDTSAQSRGRGWSGAAASGRLSRAQGRGCTRSRPAGRGPPPPSRPGPASSDPRSGRPALPRAPRGGGSGPTADSSLRPRLRAGGPGRGGGRPTSWKPDPGVAAAAASFKLAVPGGSFPASPTVPSPRLTSRAASEQEGGGEHEQEKQKQAREEPHGAVRPVPCRRLGELSGSPVKMALLFIRAPGGEGRGTYHARTFATPLSWAEERCSRGRLQALRGGVRGAESWRSRGELLGLGDSRESPPPPVVLAGHLQVPPMVLGVIGCVFLNIYF